MRFLSPLQAGASLPALRPLHAGIANREFQVFKGVVFGDSVSEGETITDYRQRWINRLQDMLRGGFPTAGVRGGDGYFPCEYTSTALPDAATQDSSTPLGGTPSFTLDAAYGLGGHSIRLANGAALIWAGHEMTSFKVHYAKGAFGVPFQVYVDGVAFGSTVATFNATSVGGFVWNSTSVSAISPGAHTIRVATTDNSGFISTISGVEFCYGDESKGIRLYDSCRSGAASTTYGADHFSTLTTIGPVQLVITELATNDAVLFNRTPSQYQSDIATHIDGINTAITNEYTHIILFVSQPNAAVTATYFWADYVQAARVVANTRPQCLVVDMADWLGATVAADVLGLWSDTVHLSPKGHALCADRMMHALDLNGGGASVPISTSYTPMQYSVAGDLTVRTGKFAFTNDTGAVMTFIKGRATVGTAPTGAGVIVAVRVDGVSEFTITIASGGTTGFTIPPAVDVPIGSKVTVDITQIGSTIAGADLSITLTAQSIV